MYEEKKVILSPAGNRTPVSRVTGGDTHHYTTEEVVMTEVNFNDYKVYPSPRTYTCSQTSPY